MTTRGSRATEDEVAAFPHRYEVGDEVEVGLDGRSSLYPSDQGWGEGTIIKVHPLVSEFPKGAFHGMDASRLGAYGVHDTGAVRSEDSREIHRESGHAAPDPQVEVVDRDAQHAHEHLARGRLRVGHVVEPQDLGPAVLVDAQGLHG